MFGARQWPTVPPHGTEHRQDNAPTPSDTTANATPTAATTLLPAVGSQIESAREQKVKPETHTQSGESESEPRHKRDREHKEDGERLGEAFDEMELPSEGVDIVDEHWQNLSGGYILGDVEQSPLLDPVNMESHKHGLMRAPDGTKVYRYQSEEGRTTGEVLLQVGLPGPFLVEVETLPEEKDLSKCWSPTASEEKQFWGTVFKHLQEEYPSMCDDCFHRCDNVPRFSTLKKGILSVSCDGQVWAESLPSYAKGRYEYAMDLSFYSIGREWSKNRVSMQLDPQKSYRVGNEWVCVTCIPNSGKEMLNCHIQAVEGDQAQQQANNIVEISHAEKEERLNQPAPAVTSVAQRQRLDVAVVIMDSVSKGTFHREMSQSLEGFEKLKGEHQYKVVEMQQLRMMGPNSWPNQLPMWSGNDCLPPPSGEDHADFSGASGIMEENDQHACGDDFLVPGESMWKYYRKHGYKTGNVEGDDCWMNFELPEMEYKVAGDIFCNASTVQAYLPSTPFKTLREKMKYFENVNEDVWYSGYFHCVAQKPSSRHFVDYTLSFWELFGSDDKFLTQNWMEGHESTQKRIRMSDPDMKYLLDEIPNRDEWRNTVLIIMSDHGANLDTLSYNDWVIGELEHRHPFMFVIVPPLVDDKYPEIATSLQVNKDTLIGYYDVHKTLKHMMHYPQEPPLESLTEKAQKAHSILKPFPEPGSRSCRDAQIWPEWCSCFRPYQVDDLVSYKTERRKH